MSLIVGTPARGAFCSLEQVIENLLGQSPSQGYRHPHAYPCNLAFFDGRLDDVLSPAYCCKGKSVAVGEPGMSDVYEPELAVGHLCVACVGLISIVDPCFIAETELEDLIGDRIIGERTINCIYMGHYCAVLSNAPIADPGACSSFCIQYTDNERIHWHPEQYHSPSTIQSFRLQSG